MRCSQLLTLSVFVPVTLLGCYRPSEPHPNANSNKEVVMTSNTATPAANPAAGGNGAQADVPLIEREVLFGNPDKSGVRLSPDGKRISYLAAVDGLMNVWVGPRDDPGAAEPVTKDKKRGIRSYFWAYTNKHILYTQDTGGDENFHIYRTDVETKETIDLTPLKKVRAEMEGVSHKFPNEILVGLNDRNEQLHDIHRVNLQTGERKLVQVNPDDQRFVGFMTDDDYRVRLAMKYQFTGATFLQPDGEGGWKEFLSVPSTDTMTTGPLDFDKSGDVLYLRDSRGRNTSALVAMDLKTRKPIVIAQHDKVDFGGALMHPTEKTILAVSYNYMRPEWKVLDDSVADDFKYLQSVADGQLLITSGTLDDKQWLVAYLMDNGPVRYYHYDRETRKAKFLFTNRKDLEKYKLAKMHSVVIKARDGLDLVSYYTLPVGSETGDNGELPQPREPLPMVLLVHGGPWSRDSWGYNSQHQWLANRGYAVLSVNFRGSTGLGKNFLNAGDKQWAGKMHNDLIDAVNWAVENKIARRDKIAIMGGSYGGYATLVGLTFTPKVFACGVDIVGPSNIITLLKTIPPYWAPFLPVLKQKVGDPSTEEGRKFMKERSPLTHVDKIVRPLLIGQGANDPRVKQAESDQIVEAMQNKKIPVCYVLYPDEGHGFARPPNRLSFYAVAEAFLSEHLGGRYQQVGDDFNGSSITVPTGAGQVPGLSEALKAVKRKE